MIRYNELTKDEHLALLTEAIAANLRARVEHDKRQTAAIRAGMPVELKMTCAAELMATDPNKLKLENIIDDPVRRALRVQLKDLGRHLFQLVGSTDKMLEVAYKVADYKPGRWGDRIDIIDKTWDGIGDHDKGNVWVA